MVGMDYTIQTICFTDSAKMRLNSAYYFGILLITHGSLFIHTGTKFLRFGTEDLLISKPGETIVLEFTGGIHPPAGFWIRLSPHFCSVFPAKIQTLKPDFMSLLCRQSH